MLHKAKLHKANSHLVVAVLLVGVTVLPALAQNTSGGTGAGGTTTGGAGTSGGNMGGGGMTGGMAGAGEAGGAMAGSGAAGGAMSGGMSHNSVLAMQTGQAMLAAIDDLFTLKAAQGNLAEVALGQLALRKTRNAQVRQLAQRLVQDHSTANTELAQVIARRGQTMPRRLGVMQQAMFDQLSRLSGNRFDQTFMAAQVEAHENSITLYQTELAQGRDEGARAYATRYLPVILEHTAMIYSLAGAVRAPGIELRPQALTTQSLTGGTMTGGATVGSTGAMGTTGTTGNTGTSGGSAFITSGGTASIPGTSGTGGGASGTGTADGGTSGTTGGGASGGTSGDTTGGGTSGGGTSNTGSGSNGATGGAR